MDERKKLVVTTSEDRSIKEVEKDLVKKGFVVAQVYESIGSIRGEIADGEKIDKLKEIPGVIDVSEEPPPVNIGPPDSPISW